MNLPLEYPIFLFLIPFGVVTVWKLTRQKNTIGFSSSALLKGIRIGSSLLIPERLFLVLFVVAASLILARPVRQVKNAVTVYKQARDIILVLDISGSMTGDRLKIAQSVISDFVAGRPQDRLALFVFNAKAFLDWPLSFDHEELIFRLNRAVADGGTVIASGVIAGLKHQEGFGQNPGAIVVVSDGGSLVTDEEKTAIEAALGQTKFYWVWIEENKKQESQEDQVAQQFSVYVTSLGGKVYRGRLKNLSEIFAEINRLEASPVLYEQRISSTYNFGVLPLVALISLLLAGLLNTMREV